MNKLKKIIWTKNSDNKRFKQFIFEEPKGYNIYTIKRTEINLKNKVSTKIDLGVSVYCFDPLVFMFTKSINILDLELLNPVQIIPARTIVPLFLEVIPLKLEEDVLNWNLKKELLIASMLPLLTSPLNLFELSNTEFGMRT